MPTVDSGKYRAFTVDAMKGIIGHNALPTCSMTLIRHRNLSGEQKISTRTDL